MAQGDYPRGPMAPCQGWQCPVCGRVNAPFVMTCQCWWDKRDFAPLLPLYPHTPTWNWKPESERYKLTYTTDNTSAG